MSQHFLQAALDLKAAGGGDVLQVDAAKGTGQQANGVDDVIHIFAADAQGEGIHIGKSLEQGAFALHHRHAGFRADIAQAQHSGAVGDNSHQVAPAGIFIAQIRILADLQAGFCNARGIGNGQVFRVFDLAAGIDFDLALPLLVGFQSPFLDVHDTKSPFI